MPEAAQGLLPARGRRVIAMDTDLNTGLFLASVIGALLALTWGNSGD